jgi:hypothetical protein
MIEGALYRIDGTAGFLLKIERKYRAVQAEEAPSGGSTASAAVESPHLFHQQRNHRRHQPDDSTEESASPGTPSFRNK